MDSKPISGMPHHVMIRKARLEAEEEDRIIIVEKVLVV